MTTLLIGGAGYIGAHTYEALIEEGEDVIILDNLSTGFLQRISPRGRFYRADIMNEGLLKTILSENKIETVIHLAASKSVRESLSNPLKYYANNISGTISLLKSLKGTTVKNLILASSCSVLGDGNSTIGFSEKPKSPYGISKMACENLCKDIAVELKLNIAILRYFNVIGCSEFTLACDLAEDAVLPNFIRKLKNGSVLEIHEQELSELENLQTRDYVDVRDVARANLAILDLLRTTNENLCCNVSSGKPVNLFEILKSLGDCVNERIEFECIGRNENESYQIWCSIDSVLEELGWRPKYNLMDSIHSQYEVMTRDWELIIQKTTMTDLPNRKS